ncbi:MAG: sigma-54-dependent Fis family transcriptional regulator [Candidatus Omnitrophica bacterium]|nr:sigma-54-dependent Fis family transcriptional regulator [Candidatus Omnitrophota bacterium]
MKKDTALTDDAQNRPLRNSTILVVDDDAVVRDILVQLLTNHSYNVIAAQSSRQALEVVKHQAPDIALLDYELPEMNGIELMGRLRETDPSIVNLIITGYGTIERAVEAMQAGAWDFLTKPITGNMLIEKMERIEEYCQLRRERRARNKLLRHDFLFSGCLCESAQMQSVYQAVLQAAESHLPVLIEGETGVGKEYLAEAIHLNSKRKENPYVVMDCTATPESLIESTLFGSTKGAFTGSIERKGLLQAADEGSLLMDEIGEISMEIQPKLLRCLETKKFRPIGSTKVATSDFRIICSTNQDLPNFIQKGKFRPDLYYRISAIRIQTPPLRERRSDIPKLAQFFLDEMVKEHHRSEMTIAPSAMLVLTHHDWPGNIRQLKYVIEAAFFRCHEQTIQEKHLQIDGHESPAKELNSSEISAQLSKDFKTYREECVLQAERNYLSLLLKKNRGDVRTSAEEAGLTREALYRIMSRCGISPNEYRNKPNDAYK